MFLLEKEMTYPMPLVTRGREIHSCLEINRKYLTIQKVFRSTSLAFMYDLGNDSLIGITSPSPCVKED